MFFAFAAFFTQARITRLIVQQGAHTVLQVRLAFIDGIACIICGEAGGNIHAMRTWHTIVAACTMYFIGIVENIFHITERIQFFRC